MVEEPKAGSLASVASAMVGRLGLSYHTLLEGNAIYEESLLPYAGAVMLVQVTLHYC